METKSLSFKFFQPAVLSVLAIIALWGVPIHPAQAFKVTLKRSAESSVGHGPSIVATGSGAIDLTGLTFVGTETDFFTGIYPREGIALTGSDSFNTATVDVYSGIRGPTIFGRGGFTPPDLASGPLVGIFREFFGGPSLLAVPHGYISDAPLSNNKMTFHDMTFADLGVIPGGHPTWTWGLNNKPNQRFTLQIGLPDAGSTFGLFFVSLIALFGVGRFCARRLA